MRKEFFPDTMIGILDTTTPIQELRFSIIVGSDKIEAVYAAFPRTDPHENNEGKTEVIKKRNDSFSFGLIKDACLMHPSKLVTLVF